MFCRVLAPSEVDNILQSIFLGHKIFKTGGLYKSVLFLINFGISYSLNILSLFLIIQGHGDYNMYHFPNKLNHRTIFLHESY